MSCGVWKILKLQGTWLYGSVVADGVTYLAEYGGGGVGGALVEY